MPGCAHSSQMCAAFRHALPPPAFNRAAHSIVQRVQSCSAFNRAARSITRHVQSRCAFECGVRQGRNRAPTPRRALVCLKISTPNASQAAQGRRVDGSLAAGCSSVHLTQAQRRCYTSAHHPSGRALPLLSPPPSPPSFCPPALRPPYLFSRARCPDQLALFLSIHASPASIHIRSSSAKFKLARVQAQASRSAHAFERVLRHCGDSGNHLFRGNNSTLTNSKACLQQTVRPLWIRSRSLPRVRPRSRTRSACSSSALRSDACMYNELLPLLLSISAGSAFPRHST